jgi:hypothetical protein
LLLKPRRAVQELVADLKLIRGAPTVTVKIGRAERRLIVDTVSSISLIQPDVATGIVTAADVTPIGVTGANLCIEGKQQVEFSLHDCIFRHLFYVCTLPTDADGLVGMDLLVKLRARLDIDNRTLEVKHSRTPTRDVAIAGTKQQANSVAFTVFTTAGDPKMNRVPLRNVKERDGRQDMVMMLHPHEI